MLLTCAIHIPNTNIMCIRLQVACNSDLRLWLIITKLRSEIVRFFRVAVENLRVVQQEMGGGSGALEIKRW